MENKSSLALSILFQVHHLLNNGAEVNQGDQRGLTALHRAGHLVREDVYYHRASVDDRA